MYIKRGYLKESGCVMLLTGLTCGSSQSRKLNTVVVEFGVILHSLMTSSMAGTVNAWTEFNLRERTEKLASMSKNK